MTCPRTKGIAATPYMLETASWFPATGTPDQRCWCAQGKEDHGSANNTGPFGRHGAKGECALRCGDCPSMRFACRRAPRPVKGGDRIADVNSYAAYCGALWMFCWSMRRSRRYAYGAKSGARFQSITE